MNHPFSFRMMQGKGGKAGHIRTEEQQITLSFRQLPPGLPCTLYRDGHVVDMRPSSPQGTLQFTCHRDGFFFLCHENNLLLWEEGENGSQNYFRAQRLMPRPEKAHAKDKNEKVQPTISETSVSGIPQSAAFQETDETPAAQPETEERHVSSTVPPALPDEPRHYSQERQPAPANDTTPPHEQHSPEKTDSPSCSQPIDLPHQEPAASPLPDSATINTAATQPPALLPRSDAPSVMTLPPLQWPPALTHLQTVFSTGTPYRPFSAPGFRCVKVPSKNPALPYCILGYQAKGSRVCSLLYAVPGHPLIPPRGFRAAQYRDGHFIRIQHLPAEHKSS